MRRPTYFVLAALLEGRAHGYGIIGRASGLSNGKVRLTAGTLYGALDRLAAEGLVEGAGEEVVNGRRRRYYQLTAAGREAVTAEARLLETAAKAVLRSRVSAIAAQA